MSLKYEWSEKQDKRRQERRPICSRKQASIKKRSSKGQKEDRLYNELAKAYKVGHPFCEARLPCCTKKTTEIHHRKGRRVWLLVIKYFLGVCHNCHTYIESHPEEAKKKGFSLRCIE